MKSIFFDRDLSWLSFNARVLEEAQREQVPLMERLKFLSIYSSNLDEFYRVRMPALMALHSLSNEGDHVTTLKQVEQRVQFQQQKFGSILTKTILPQLITHQIKVIFNEPIPDAIKTTIANYFFEHVAGYICITALTGTFVFFPENNKLYLLATALTTDNKEQQYIITIPSDHVPRFYSVTSGGIHYIVFLDDIIRFNLPSIFKMYKTVSAYSFKITRDAELDLKDEYEGNLAKKIEKEISKRDLGLATRFLYQSGMPSTSLSLLARELRLQQATFVEGGTYHNLKDLALLPIESNRFVHEPWPKVKYITEQDGSLLSDAIRKREMLLHPPYDSYETVIRFFNEAAIDPQVTHIYITLYRVASDSRIANALIHAAKNGKKVTVFIELKARFDEANNIKWARKMKGAGVRIISSIPELKVHAKIALVKRVIDKQREYMGLFSTGNFNESTARFYTDHVLLTANIDLLKEAEQLFVFLKKRRKPKASDSLYFNHLLVAQFNLQKQFMTLIDREIDFAKQGLPASITIKMNNLEDQVLITKLYEASQAGVRISLIIRSICCLVPGVKGMSENIRVIRIVDRYLEHGRVFVFHNNGDTRVFLGSADWMNRNIYRRIEVCFPVDNPEMKTELIQILAYQLADTAQAVSITETMENKSMMPNPTEEKVQSQKEISLFLTRR